MKLVTFSKGGGHRLGAVTGQWDRWEGIADLNEASKDELPSDMMSFVELAGKVPESIRIAQEFVDSAKNIHRPDDVSIHVPLVPRLLRDTIAFRGHIARTRAARGMTVAPEWDKLPAYYNGNHLNMVGPGDSVSLKKFLIYENGGQIRETLKLDYETEVAFIIGKGGKDIDKGKAASHLFGFTIFNDFSMRDLQLTAMGVGMGPAAGKDWANALGPCVVTKDEFGKLNDKRIITKVNGSERLNGVYKDLVFKSPFVRPGERPLWSFEEMVEFISHSQHVHAGEVWGSGTIPGGCELENGDKAQYLKRGDVVEIEVEGIGTLRNKIA